ncbi:MAG: tryptophan synthase subunit alpha [Deltaproteobacteria bacterium]|nr:tryptophan synthase subunit alpha [Candidatus Zymogenaceae bacterium]
MNRIDAVFSRLEEKNEAALVIYLTAGDPDIETTEELLKTIQNAGADIIEVGIPFSDPMADGPTIQRAAKRALDNGVTLTRILDMVSSLRDELTVPIVLFGYYNPILSYGPKRFAKAAAKAGVDGVLVVDLPPEEKNELTRFTEKEGIHFITLVSPVSDGERISGIIEEANGFLYYVSVTGVTGARDKLPEDLAGGIERVREMAKIPVAVGFGVSSPEMASQLGSIADGVVVGSALVDIIEKQGDDKKRLLEEVGGFVSSLKTSLIYDAPQAMTSD